MVEGGATRRDIEYIRKGMLDLSVTFPFFYIYGYQSDLKIILTDVGLEIRTNAGIYTHLAAKFFMGRYRMSIFIPCFFPLTTIPIRQLKSFQNVVLFWIVLFN
jgi:hypothetical protein